VAQPVFQVLEPQWDATNGTATLHYQAPDGSPFTETHTYGAIAALSAAQQQALHQSLRATAIAAAASYYKAFYPCQISVEWPLTNAEATFFSTLYRHGLGEFAVRNGFDLTELATNTTFTASNAQPQPTTLALTNHHLTLVGGGKDSVVSIEALRAMAAPQTLLAVNPSPPIEACLTAAELPNWRLKRTLDPQLFALNKAGAPNGHVPITAIISLMAVTAAILRSYSTVVLSNERSAEEATTTHHGTEVNHQYSKSLAFESALADYLATHISPDVQHFSLLRPLSELQIAAKFSQSERYDAAFTSCNNAHKIIEQRQLAHNGRWCGRCPKCTFTYLLLATTMPIARLDHIFGANLLNEPTNLAMYRELTGLSGHKPWECVGELTEAAAALQHLAQQPAWQDSAIVQTLAPEIEARYGDLSATWQALHQPSAQHNLTATYFQVVTHG
jgi:hypothetical protein